MELELKLEVGKYYLTRDGSRVGPMCRYRDGTYFHLGYGREGLWRVDGCDVWDDGKNDLIAEWHTSPTGPVRTVTCKEIVPGVYGLVTVENRVGGCRLALPRDNFFCADNVDELRAAIATLTEIADAMEARDG